MNNNLCFKIEQGDLFLDQILVDFNGFPVFFICKQNEQYYIVLCIDLDNMEYYIIRSNPKEILRMLKCEIDMRATFLAKNEFWHVVSGENVDSDIVEKKHIDQIDHAFLPFEGAKYDIISEEMKNYLNSIEQMINGKNNFNFKGVVNKYIELLPLSKKIFSPSQPQTTTPYLCKHDARHIINNTVEIGNTDNKLYAISKNKNCNSCIVA